MTPPATLKMAESLHLYVVVVKLDEAASEQTIRYNGSIIEIPEPWMLQTFPS